MKHIQIEKEKEARKGFMGNRGKKNIHPLSYKLNKTHFNLNNIFLLFYPKKR